jgi:isopenicillin N synthase-like dioxygenase
MTDSPTFQVPVIDISPFIINAGPDAKGAVARQIDRAFRSHGILQIVGHGISDSVVHGLAAAMDAYFDLAPADKLVLQMPPEINRGYSPPSSESLRKSIGVSFPPRPNDYFEAFNVGAAVSDYPDQTLPLEHYPENVWPAEPVKFRESIGDYYREAKRVADAFTGAMAVALGLDERYFAGMTTHSVEMLRLINYPVPSEPGHPAMAAAMGEHTDFGLVTMLWTDRKPGLQVLGPDRVWHDVVPAVGALVVHLGDLMARLTNDAWLATLHRVQRPMVDGSVAHRRSAAFFHDGNIDAVIEPLPRFVDSDEHPLYEPTTVRENLVSKLRGARSGQRNYSAARDAARVRDALRSSDT